MAGEKEILDAGANSVVYKDVIDGRDVVVKTSRNHDDVWLFCAQKENKMLAMLKDQKQNLAADIPEMRLEQENGETRIIQTAVKGEFLTRETYLSCSAEQQDKIARDLAEAMFAIHNLDIAEVAKVTNDGYIPGEKPGVKNSERYFRGNYQSLIDSLGKHISPETKSTLENFIENQFDALEKVNSRVAPIHNDIRYSNIFYDKETSKVGIIDFGSCEVYDIYHDFASIGLPNSLGFELQEKVIDSYNKLLRKNGRDFQLSAETVRAFLLPEIANCKHTIDDETCRLNVHMQGPMCDDALTKTPEQINPILDRLKFSPKKRAFWFDYFVHPVHERQKAPPLSILQNGGKKEIINPFGLATDAFYSVYTEIHELMHGCQAKYFAPAHSGKFYQEHYELLYAGKSRDEAITIQTARNPELAATLHSERCFMEMQANAAASCYMMLQAVSTGDENIIAAVEKRLVNEAASMSGALMNENLGLAYFEYPATKNIIAEAKQGKCGHLLNGKGLLDWKQLYAYTQTKVEEMGYNKEDMAKSLETAKMLKELKKRCGNDKEAFLNEVCTLASQLEHPHGRIFRDFVAAQRDFVPDDSKKLHFFYHRLGIESSRDETLAAALPENVPNIEEYRQIWQAHKNMKTPWLTARLKRERE